MLITDFLAEVGRMFDVTVDDLRGPCRKQALCRARFAAYAALRERGASFAQIGRWLGDRDHTTVMHGADRAEYLMSRDELYRDMVEYLADYKPAQKAA